MASGSSFASKALDSLTGGGWKVVGNSLLLGSLLGSVHLAGGLKITPPWFTRSWGWFVGWWVGNSHLLGSLAPGVGSLAGGSEIHTSLVHSLLGLVSLAGGRKFTPHSSGWFRWLVVGNSHLTPRVSSLAGGRKFTPHSSGWFVGWWSEIHTSLVGLVSLAGGRKFTPHSSG